MKFLGQIESPTRHARVYNNSQFEEHVVKFYEAEEYQTEADYHCSDFTDAVQTALHWVNDAKPENNAPGALTFEQFQQTHTVDTDPLNIMELSGHCEGTEVIYVAAHVYADDCWIMEYAPGKRPFKYWLLIETSEWESDDLAELERHLYDNWYLTSYQG